MLLIFNCETRFCKFSEFVPKFTVIVGVTGVGVWFTGWVFDEEDEEVVLLELEVDVLPFGLLVEDEDEEGLLLEVEEGVGNGVGVGALEEVALPCEEVEELLWVVLPLLPALFTGVGVGDEDVVLEVVGVGLLTGVEGVDELLLVVVGLLLLLDVDEDEVDLTGLVGWLLFTGVLELLDWEVEFWEAVWDELELFTLFDVDTLVGVLSVLVELTVVLLLEAVFTFVSLLEVVVFWLAGWLVVGTDDPQDTTQAGITQATAAIPTTPPKIFQIFFFIQ